MTKMTKQNAIDLFGKGLKPLGLAVRRKSSALSQWPDVLTDDQRDLVIGAAVRLKKKIPKELLQ